MQLKRGINKLIDWRKFSLERYGEFLQSISIYKVLPLREFNKYHNPAEIVIGIRHDIDRNFGASQRMQIYEVCFVSMSDIRSTYFILHTAWYYRHYKHLFEILKEWQADDFEIGLHNDMLSLDKKIDQKHFLEQGLKELRDHGLNIIGTAAHGTERLKRDKKNNDDFWKIWPLKQFGFEYRAYGLDHNIYFSDCTFINNHRWHPDMFDWTTLKPGDRVQILIHPEWWHS